MNRNILFSLCLLIASSCTTGKWPTYDTYHFMEGRISSKYEAANCNPRATVEGQEANSRLHYTVDTLVMELPIVLEYKGCRYLTTADILSENFTDESFFRHPNVYIYMDESPYKSTSDEGGPHEATYSCKHELGEWWGLIDREVEYLRPCKKTDLLLPFMREEVAKLNGADSILKLCRFEREYLGEEKSRKIHERKQSSEYSKYVFVSTFKNVHGDSCSC